MRRKFLSVVLCVCMMLTMAPFAFATGSDDTSTTNTQEQAPVANSSSGGSGGSTTSVSLPNDNTGDLTISTDNAVLDGTGLTYTNGTITVTAANVTIKNLTFGNGASLKVNADTFTLVGCTFNSTTKIRTPVTLNVSNATVTGNSFDATQENGDPSYYNAIEFTVNAGTSNARKLQSATLSGNTFNAAITNNYFSAYYFENNAKVTVENNTIKLQNKESNAIRISNSAQATGVEFTLNNNSYDYGTGPDSEYEGFILLQDFSNSDTQDFTSFKINISNLMAPESAKTLFYVYSDKSKSIITTNQPIVKGDSSIAKFCSARIGDTYYKTLADAYAALPRNVGANSTPTTITVLKDSDGEAIGSDSDKDMNYVIDFSGHTYTVGKPTVGSTGTETQGLRVLKGSTAVFKNGTLKAANYQNMKMPVHTYGDVTFQDFTVDAREDSYASVAYEIDNGSLEMLGNSSILAYSGKTGLYVAFWPRGNYVDGTTVTINTTGKITGKLVYEWDDVADPDKQQKENLAVLNIKNGNFAITKIQTLFTHSIPDNLKVPKISITGGYFTTDPTPYCGKDADGNQLTGIPSNDSTYPFTVGTLTANVDVATADPAVKTPSNIDSMPDAEKAVVNNAVSAAAGTTATGLDAIGGKEATNVTSSEVNTAKEQLSKTSGVTINTGDSVTLYVQPYLAITVTGAEVASGTTEGSTTTTSLSLNITPMIKKIASTAENAGAIKTEGEGKNAVQIGDAEKVLNVNTPVTIKFALPTGFAQAGDKLSIKHTKENGSIEYYTGTVSTEGEGDSAKTYVTFTTNGFSPFVIYAASANVASTGNNVYPSFQAAVDAAQNNDEITLLKGDAVSATMTGSSKTIKVKAGSGVTTSINVTVNGESKTLGNGTAEVTFTYTRPSSSTPTTYAVNVNAATNGAVAADKKTASKGTTVTVTASPSKGYVVDAVKVVDKDGKDVAVTEKDGKYVFTMPGSAVTVTGTFKAETPAPAALPFTDVKSGNWFYDAVKYAYAQGLMTGTSATTFAPNGTMNRAMIVTVLYRLEKSPAVTGASKFTDVPAGQWYSDAVAWAAANKIVNGYDETTFGPMNAVTREQMAAILFRYEQVKGLENVTLEENLNRFPDQNKISAYAIPALQWAVGQKIINGNADGTLDPTGTATRAQVAQIFTNLLNK